MKKIDVVLGLQWGDEGKGKVVDVLTPDYQVIARFQGGPNAGHSLHFEGKKYVLHTIPSGIFRDGSINIIGNGVVIDPVILSDEIATLEADGVDVQSKLLIAKKAHLILPTHRIIDAASEASKGKTKIGSTLKGIGPTYMDKTGRNGLLDEGKAILAEGAQGSMLDIDFGTYPFVTSSNTLCAGVCTGLGVAPSRIGNVYGIFKAYCTRVGSGPFPTELFDEDGEKMRRIGMEFGATTGRPRRCGWLDMVALRYSVMMNGVTALIMMKSDVLNDFEKLKVAVAYKVDGKETTEFPYEVNGEIVPVYKEFEGWNCNINGIRNYDQFPTRLKEYIEFIEKETGVPVKIVSVGPDREETIIR